MKDFISKSNSFLKISILPQISNFFSHFNFWPMRSLKFCVLGIDIFGMVPVNNYFSSNFAVTTFSNSLLGGENRTCSFDIMEKYDPKLDVWSFSPSMKRKRAGAGCAVCEGKIYVAGKCEFST
jgi:hypothetical protein